MSEASGNVRTELVEIAKRKLELAETLANLERQIYGFETSMLENTHPYGNIISGWNRNHRPANELPNSTNEPRNKAFKESDRLFSMSSVTTMPIVSGLVEYQEIAKINSETESQTESSDSEDYMTKKSGKSDGPTTARNSSASYKKTSTKKK